jgi:Tol biopolymer transport system component
LSRLQTIAVLRKATLLAGATVALLGAGCQELIVSGPPADISAADRAARMAYLDSDRLWVLDLEEDISVRVATGVEPSPCAPYYVSPDGEWVAYLSADGRPWLASTDGAQSFRLADQDVGFLSWFPDSHAIVYSAGQEIYIRRTDTAGEPQIFSMAGLEILSPAWSPEGRYIAFLEAMGGDEIKVMSFEPETEQLRGLGSVSLAVTSTVASNMDCAGILTWSPDSTKFLMNLGTSTLIFYLSGGNPILVGPSAPIREASWAHDGRALALIDEAGGLWTVSADGSNLRQMSQQPIQGLSWSPADHTLAYSAADGSRVENIFLVELPRGSIRQLTVGNAYRKVRPQWTPDGRRIVFQRLSPGGKPAGIWSASPRDSGARLVVNRGTHFSIFESRRR